MPVVFYASVPLARTAVHLDQRCAHPQPRTDAIRPRFHRHVQAVRLDEVEVLPVRLAEAAYDSEETITGSAQGVDWSREELSREGRAGETDNRPAASAIGPLKDGTRTEVLVRSDTIVLACVGGRRGLREDGEEKSAEEKSWKRWHSLLQPRQLPRSHTATATCPTTWTAGSRVQSWRRGRRRERSSLNRRREGLPVSPRLHPSSPSTEASD